MANKHNFGAGPCVLPDSVLEQAAGAVVNWNGSGLSILEVSHRSAEFEDVVLKTQLLIRDLLDIPDNYSVLFLQGGASTQFSMIPLNFLQGKSKASYLDTGYFAQKAIKEARLFGEVEVVASSSDRNYKYIPENYTVSEDSAYLHITSNNTIEGTEIFEFSKINIPLICDMSSDIFSRPIDVSQFDLIYAGAQKNMGPAGMTLVIAKNEFLNSVSHQLPSMSDYRVFRDNQSMYNTPPVFAIYVAMLNLLWLKEQGGVTRIESLNIQKAKILYDEIERNSLFIPTADMAYRSRMNVTFQATDKETEKLFLNYVANKDIVGIAGYRAVGGFRASLYNGLDIKSVEKLIELMKDFERTMSDSKVLANAELN